MFGAVGPPIRSVYVYRCERPPIEKTDGSHRYLTCPLNAASNESVSENAYPASAGFALTGKLVAASSSRLTPYIAIRFWPAMLTGNEAERASTLASSECCAGG